MAKVTKNKTAKKTAHKAAKAKTSDADIDEYKIIKYPLSTEKAIRLMEAENKLLFVVNNSAKKSEIKQALEKMFKTKIMKVNTYIAPSGEKRAYVKFSMETPAIDIATQLGLM